MLRTPDAYLASLQDNPRRAPFSTDAARTNINPLPAKRRQGLQSREQMPACGKITVLRGANDDIDIVRPARKMRVNIAFPVGHHHHRRRRVPKHAGGAGPFQPAVGFLVRKIPRAPVSQTRVRTRPDLAPAQAEQRFGVDVHRDQRMDEKTQRLAVTGRPQPLAAPVTAGEIDLRGVLGDDNAPPLGRVARARGETIADGFKADVGGLEKAVRADFSGPIPAKLPDNQRTAFHNRLKNPLAPPVHLNVPGAKAAHLNLPNHCHGPLNHSLTTKKIQPESNVCIP